MISNNHISQIVLVRSVTSSGSQWHSAVGAGANASCSDKVCGHCVSLAKSSSAIQFVIGRCVRAPERNANVSGKRCFHSKRPKTTSNCQAVSPQRLPPSEVLRMAMKRVRFGELFQSAEFPPIAGGVPSASVHEFFPASRENGALYASRSREDVLDFRPSAAATRRAAELLDLDKQGRLSDELRYKLDQFEQAELLMRLVKARIRAKQH